MAIRVEPRSSVSLSWEEATTAIPSRWPLVSLRSHFHSCHAQGISRCVIIEFASASCEIHYRLSYCLQNLLPCSLASILGAMLGLCRSQDPQLLARIALQLCERYIDIVLGLALLFTAHAVVIPRTLHQSQPFPNMACIRVTLRDDDLHDSKET